MTGFIEGRSRDHAMLFPARLDDAILAENPVRVIDAFIGALDLKALGFDIEAEATGCPGYHPATMLRIYLYGYLNQVQSSRRLERKRCSAPTFRLCSGRGLMPAHERSF